MKRERDIADSKKLTDFHVHLNEWLLLLIKKETQKQKSDFLLAKESDDRFSYGERDFLELTAFWQSFMWRFFYLLLILSSFQLRRKFLNLMMENLKVGFDIPRGKKSSLKFHPLHTYTKKILFLLKRNNFSLINERHRRRK